MIAEVANRRDEIAARGQRFRVRRLELFGSAARGDFDPATSDFGFILGFDESKGNLLGRFIGPGDALAELLGRPVDFVFEERFTEPGSSRQDQSKQGAAVWRSETKPASGRITRLGRPGKRGRILAVEPWRSSRAMISCSPRSMTIDGHR